MNIVRRVGFVPLKADAEPDQETVRLVTSTLDEFWAALAALGVGPAALGLLAAVEAHPGMALTWRPDNEAEAKEILAAYDVIHTKVCDYPGIVAELRDGVLSIRRLQDDN
jgi:hypothetical protein